MVAAEQTLLLVLEVLEVGVLELLVIHRDRLYRELLIPVVAAVAMVVSVQETLLAQAAPASSSSSTPYPFNLS